MKKMSLVILMVSASLGWSGVSQALDNQVQEIRDRGVLKACHAEAYPWGVKDPETNKWNGSDIEAAKSLADALGVKVEHVDSTWGTLVPSLEASKCDIIMAPMFRTAERAVRILFSDPTGYETKSVTIGPDADIADYSALDQKGKIVVVVSGSADESFANRYLANAEVKALVTDKVSTLAVDVASGRADAMITDSSSANKIASENTSMGLSILESDSPLDPQGYSYGVRKGEYHFLNLVNVWQEAAEQQGLKAKWSAMFK